MSRFITLSHGNGGKHMRLLIEEIFAKHLSNDLLDTNCDAALLPELNKRLMMTVDSFTVQPLFFPGGDIGSLCIHGTVNDLAVSGAIAKFISLSAIIEEGLAFDMLDAIVKNMAQAANACGVSIVCGDTKVVPRGQGSEVYFTTTGIGYQSSLVNYSASLVKPGDKILVSGTVGDHGAAIMLSREQFGLSGNIQSDNASVLPVCQSVYGLEGIRFMRDPTRGGIASVMHEISQSTGHGIQLNELDVPVLDEVRTICDMLGYEPYYMANEGCVVAIVDAAIAEDVLHLWRNEHNARYASIVGEVTDRHNQVVIKTAIGGERMLPELVDEPLPRIC